MSLSVYLESQKQAIMASMAIQNAKKQNNTSADFSDSRISIFSDLVKNQISTQSEICNQFGSQVSSAKNKGQAEVAQSLAKANGGISELESLISWAGAASQDFAGVAGISDSALSSISQNLGSAVQYGAKEISNTVSNINQAISRISTPENQPINSAVQTIQNNINTVASNATATSNQVTQSTLATQQPGTTDASAKVAATDIKTTDTKTDKVQAKPAKDVNPVANTAVDTSVEVPATVKNPFTVGDKK